MLDLADQPLLEKKDLVGACLRLPIRVDAHALGEEVAALPAEAWLSRGGRVGVHNVAASIFLRGYAPWEGEKPIEDRPPLAALPSVRELMARIGAPPARCLLARLPARAVISPHVDRAPYFWKTIRIHVAVETHERAFMLCDGFTYVMRAGEVWALNNNTTHAVWNDHARMARTHLICDFLASETLFGLLARGERDLGVVMPEAERHVRSVTGGMMAAG